MRSFGVSAAVVLAALASGCGGGGGTSSPAAKLAPAELNSVYTYDVSVVSGRADSVTGRMTLTIVRDGDLLSKQGLIELDDGTRSFSSEVAAYFTQDTSGALFYAGKRNPLDGRETLSESRALSVRSPLKSGDAWSSSTVLDGGSRESWRSVVGSPESVAAGGRVFVAYPIQTTRQSDLGSSVCTAWYSPEHPAPVKAMGLLNGLQVTITLTGVGRDAVYPELDSPPAPPMSDAGYAGGIDLDTPPPPPAQWQERGQDAAAIICEMLI